LSEAIVETRAAMRARHFVESPKRGYISPDIDHLANVRSNTIPMSFLSFSYS
jgi:hypothetical protein